MPGINVGAAVLTALTPCVWVVVLPAQTEPSRRLGARGADEVRQHPFFRGIDWANLHQSSAAHVPVIASLDDGGLDDYSAMPSLGSMILTDESTMGSAWPLPNARA